MVLEPIDLSCQPKPLLWYLPIHMLPLIPGSVPRAVHMREGVEE